MYKGITLLETLIVLFILSLTLAFALPKWQKNDPKYFSKRATTALFFLTQYSSEGRKFISDLVYFGQSR